MIGLGLAVSFVSYTFNDRIAPYANLKVAEFNDHRQDIVGETSKPFDLANRKDGKLQTTVHIEKGFDAQAKVLRQVTITSLRCRRTASAPDNLCGPRKIAGRGPERMDTLRRPVSPT